MDPSLSCSRGSILYSSPSPRSACRGSCARTGPDQMKLDDGIDKDELEEVTRPANAYARYGALGIQMALMVILGILGGRWLDGVIGWKFPLFTLLLMFLGLAGAIWLLLRAVRN